MLWEMSAVRMVKCERDSLRDRCAVNQQWKRLPKIRICYNDDRRENDPKTSHFQGSRAL